MENLEIDKPKPVTQQEYYKQAIIAALAIGVLATLPQYVNWGLNKTIFDPVVSSVFQIICITAILYVYGKKMSLASDTGDGYTFGQAYGFAMIVSLFSGIVCALLGWLLVNVIDKSMVAKLINDAVTRSEQLGLGQDAIDVAVASAQFFTSMGGLMIINVLSMAIFGGFLGLITSAIVKRNAQLL